MSRHAVLVLMVSISMAVVGMAQEGVRADVPFSFIVAGKTLPAGTYTFREAETGRVMAVRNDKTGDVNMAPVLTRLGQRSGDESEVVFDVVGNDHYLAEVHVAEIDGYAFKAAQGKHTHTGVKAKK